MHTRRFTNQEITVFHSRYFTFNLKYYNALLIFKKKEEHHVFYYRYKGCRDVFVVTKPLIKMSTVVVVVVAVFFIIRSA